MIYEFQKAKLVYNAHRLRYPVEVLCLVEGFPSVWWLRQMGAHNVVALMGWSMSEQQAEIVRQLVMPSGRVWMIPDGYEAGKR